ncbi:MAG: hypothetical protein Q4Q17_03085 [Tissierellia bacterium]|nr:hypothetical protein [Tissierellia bacterium]
MLINYGLGERVQTFHSYNLIPSVDSFAKRQVSTHDFDVFGELKNNCASASMLNLWIYYMERGILPKKDIQKLMSFLHGRVGSGPITPVSYRLFFPRLTEETFQWKPKKHSFSLQQLPSILDEGHPVLLLLYKPSMEFHYVQALGYDEEYILVCDNWSHHSLRQLDLRKTKVFFKWYYTFG